jgi:hypothetical protein
MRMHDEHEAFADGEVVLRNAVMLCHNIEAVLNHMILANSAIDGHPCEARIPIISTLKIKLSYLQRSRLIFNYL